MDQKRNKYLEALRKAIGVALDMKGNDVLPYYHRKRGSSAPYAIVNTTSWELRGTPSIVRTAEHAESVEKAVLSQYVVTYTVDFLRGDPLQSIFDLTAWLRTEAAQRHFAPMNMTYISTSPTLDLTSLEAHDYTPRYQTELIFNVGVITAGYDVDTATVVPVSGKRDFNVAI